MSPPAAQTEIGIGVSASPTKADLIRAGRLVLDNCGIEFGQNKLVRLVLRFKERAPMASGQMFFAFLANAASMSQAQRQDALANPDVARVIAYRDPTGEAAVNNVMNRRSHGR